MAEPFDRPDKVLCREMCHVFGHIEEPALAVPYTHIWRSATALAQLPVISNRVSSMALDALLYS